MTEEEKLAENIVKNIDYDKILNNLNEWGATMTEEEKKELFKKGGIL